MTYGTTPEQAGPNHDGSKSLAKESKVGQVVNFGVAAVAGAALLWLKDFNPESVSAFWWGPIAIAGAGTAAGFLSAWLKKNR